MNDRSSDSSTYRRLSPATDTRSSSGRIRSLLVPGIAAFIAASLFAALFGWRQWREAGSAQPPWPTVSVAAMRITPTDVPVYLSAVGSLRAVHEVSLSPETAGRVVSIGFEGGQMVEAGTLLVQLFDAPEHADRAAALARADLAKAELARTKRLMDSGAASRETLDQHIAERDQALAAVRQFDARIEQKQIRAPFTGTLGIRRIDLGQYLNPGDAIVNLTDRSYMYVDFSVPQQEMVKLKTASSVRITSDAWPGREFVATVDTVEPRISPNTRNITIRAILPNPDGALRSGMFVNVKLQLPAEPDQLVVPTTAIRTTAAGDSVVLIRGPEATKQGTAEDVRVTVGRRMGDNAIISHGLQAGDVVITEGQLRVHPGTQVQVTQLQSAAGT